MSPVFHGRLGKVIRYKVGEYIHAGFQRRFIHEKLWRVIAGLRRRIDVTRRATQEQE